MKFNLFAKGKRFRSVSRCFSFRNTKGRHHSWNNRRDHFSRKKVYTTLCDLATGIGQRSRAVWSLFYKSHSTFLARSQETTSCRIRTGNDATIVNRIPNELIERLAFFMITYYETTIACCCHCCLLQRKMCRFCAKKYWKKCHKSNVIFVINIWW